MPLYIIMGKKHINLQHWLSETWFGWAVCLLWFVIYFMMLRGLLLFCGAVVLVFLTSIVCFCVVRMFYLGRALPETLGAICMGIFQLILIFGLVYEGAGILDHSGNLVKDKLISIYFSIVTFTTLGYGDYRPSSSVRWAAAIEALLGYIFMGILVALVVTSILKRPNTSAAQPKFGSEDGREKLNNREN